MFYDTSRTEPRETDADFHCEKCGEELYGEDHVYSISGGKLVCSECYLRSVLNKDSYRTWMDEDTADGIAELIMDDVFTAEEARENVYGY